MRTGKPTQSRRASAQERRESLTGHVNFDAARVQAFREVVRAQSSTLAREGLVGTALEGRGSRTLGCFASPIAGPRALIVGAHSNPCGVYGLAGWHPAPRPPLQCQGSGISTQPLALQLEIEVGCLGQRAGLATPSHRPPLLPTGLIKLNSMRMTDQRGTRADPFPPPVSQDPSCRLPRVVRSYYASKGDDAPDPSTEHLGHSLMQRPAFAPPWQADKNDFLQFRLENGLLKHKKVRNPILAESTIGSATKASGSVKGGCSRLRYTSQPRSWHGLPKRSASGPPGRCHSEAPKDRIGQGELPYDTRDVHPIDAQSLLLSPRTPLDCSCSLTGRHGPGGSPSTSTSYSRRARKRAGELDGIVIAPGVTAGF